MERKDRTALLFPAFGARPLGDEQDALDAFGVDRGALIDACNSAACPGETPLPEALRLQLEAYMISSAFASLPGIPPAGILCGYSMGLYAAFQNAGAYSFEDGARLISRAHVLMDGATAGKRYLSAVITGLVRSDIVQIISRGGSSAEIVNVNNAHSLMVTAPEEEMPYISAAAKGEGALNVTIMGHALPYHTGILRDAALAFRDELETFPLERCHIPVLSSRTARPVETPGDVRDELARNLCVGLDWHRAMAGLLERGVRLFIECGTGRSLTRFSRFIPGEFTIMPAAEYLSTGEHRRNVS